MANSNGATMMTNLSRRDLLARSTILPMVGVGVAAMASSQHVEATETADPVIGYFKMWQKAAAETKAASVALGVMFAEEKRTGVKHPDRDAIFDREGEMSERELIILEAIKDTPAATLGGVLCKAVVANKLMPTGDGDYGCEFGKAAFQDIERLLHNLS